MFECYTTASRVITLQQVVYQVMVFYYNFVFKISLKNEGFNN